ncbi:hypothetical protein GBA52_011367 [Prunus armeniaca]|nr:hypothetical protein GBA52_011367 [Prunus armeniaca]
MNQLRICCENLKDLQVCGMEKICLDISGMGLERLAVKLHLTSVISNSCVNIFAPNLQTSQLGPDEVAEKGLVHFWLPVNDAKVELSLAWIKNLSKLIKNTAIVLGNKLKRCSRSHLDHFKPLNHSNPKVRNSISQPKDQ